MKVICISQPANVIFTGGAKSIVEVGESYNVIDSSEPLINGLPAYEFSEHIGFLYAQKNFIPVSEVDEATFERNYKKELV